MDRPLPDAVHRATWFRRFAAVVLPLAGVIALIALLPGWMRPTVSRTRIRTATVTTGSIDATITATGVVMPDVERVLSSQVDARVLRVVRRPGASVETGDAVVELDLGESVLALDRMVTDVLITENEQAQVRLALDKSLADLDHRIERASLELQMLTAKAGSARQLFEEGLASQQALREASLAARQQEIELAQLRSERTGTEAATRLKSEGLALERTAFEKGAIEARRVLELATMRSDRRGVLTWVLPQEGALVRKGEVIARIADLSSYHVEASISDVHASHVRPGAPVRVLVNDETLDGSTSQVIPGVENGVIRFIVTLKESSHGLLRPNMRVDVFLVTDFRPSTLKVLQGSFATGAGGTGQAFVVRGERAVRADLRLGVRGMDEVEIVSGLLEGDEVIVSDMRAYLHLKELAIR